MSYCKITPTITNIKGKEVDSKLFKELFNLTKDRELTKKIWGLTRVPGFLKLENLQLDENGEPTLQSLQNVLNISDFLTDVQKKAALSQSAGFTNKKGDLIVHKNINSLIDIVNTFNNDNLSYVANIITVEDGYVVEVEDKTFNNALIPAKLQFKKALNNKLLGILNSLGFDVSFSEDENIDGVFNPLNAEKNAENLKVIISVAKGDRGEEAFPEEFSHVIIEGLKNTTLGQRVLGLFNNIDTIKTVLGDQYDTYYSKYNGNVEYLKREAAAKILAEYTKGNTDSPLIKRFWNTAKSLLAKGSTQDVDAAIEEAQTYFTDILDEIDSGDIVKTLNKEDIVSAPTLYAITSSVNKKKELAERGLEMMKRKMKILSLRSKEGEYDEALLEEIKKAQKHYDEHRYVSSCMTFMQEALDSLLNIRRSIAEYDGNPKKLSDIQEIKFLSINLRALKEFSESYTPIIRDLCTIDYLVETGEVDLSDTEIQEIKSLASSIRDVIDLNNKIYNKLRFKVVFDFLKMYWGEDKIINIGKHKGEVLSLELLLKYTNGELGLLDSLVSSMSDTSDPLMGLIHRIVKDSKDKRDDRVRDILAGVENAHKKLADAGYSNDFIFERDSEGVPTGRLISDWNWSKFYEDRSAYIAELKQQTDDPFEIKAKIEAWEAHNMEPIVVDEKSGRVEAFPKTSNPDWYKEGRLKSLSKEQKEYYDYMMSVKSELDSLLPNRYVSKYKAIQVRNDVIEAFNPKDPKGSAKMIISNIKDNFVRREDNVSYGETVTDSDTLLGNMGQTGVKSQMLDLLGNPIQKVPVYYTMDIEDKRRLSTDFTATIMAYADMAVNYDEMSKIVDVMELVRDTVYQREHRQMQGEDVLVDAITVLKEKIVKPFNKIGINTGTAKRLDDFYASSIYGQKKKDEGTIQLGKNKIEVAPVLDAVKSYSSALKLGINLFSGISNAVVGNTQMFIESMGGEFFGKLDLALATKDYYALLPNLLGEYNSTKKTNLLDLLIDRFDALEEFSSNLREKGYYKSWTGRILGNANMFFLNHAGEHMLHTKTMLAVLRSTKVKLDGKEISLFEAFDTKDFGSKGVKLVLKKGVTTLEGELLSSNDDSFSESKKAEIDKRLYEFIKPIKYKIRRANQTMHGAYGNEELGAINRNALGRMAMQFRQWMPTHYYRRFGSATYDAQLDTWREGYYRTYGRFLLNLIKDIRHGESNYRQLRAGLSEEEKSNIRKARTELSIFGILSLLIHMLGPVKDREGNWGERMLAYQLMRLKLETGASIPWTSFFDNALTIVKSPIPAADTFDGLLNIFEVWNIFDEIESGTYKGWSVYTRDLFKAIPIANQVKRVADISTEEYMFAIFDN